MAKRVKKNTNGRVAKGSEKSRKREISGLLLTALSIFVLVALLTNIRAVWFGYPTGGITGRPGAWLSRVIFESIGIAGFPAAVVLGIFSVNLFMHRPLRDALKPSILILVLGLFIPIIISIVGGVSSSASYGGIIGVFLASQMVTWLSRFGAFLAVLTIILVTVVLTTSLKISTMVEYLLAAGKWAGSAASGAVKQSKGNGKPSRKVKTPSGASSRAAFPLDDEPDYDDPFLTPPEAVDNEEYTEAAKPLHEPEIQYPERLRTPPSSPKPELEDEPVSESESPDWELDEEAEHLAEAARAAYVLPGPDLLDAVVDDPMPESREEMLEKAQRIVESLRHFNVEAEVKQITPGPIVTRYELTLAPGVKVGRIVSLADDLAMALKARGPIRILAPIPGKAAIGVEVPNKMRATVWFREIVESGTFRDSGQPLVLALGKNTAGEPVVADLARMPHLLIAGSTGSGKSVCINSIVASILMSARPDEVRIIMVDPKVVELTVYNAIPHLLTPVVTDPRRAEEVLKWAVSEMESRYRDLASFGVRDILQYNAKIARMKGEAAAEGNEEIDVPDPLPYMVVIIDEFADLMVIASNEVEEYIARLAQMARAVGIHLVLATQRPSADVITGLIKANFPSRIAFKVMQASNSRIILDQNGADKLLGLGDMLFLQVGKPEPIRLHGAYISNDECQRIADFVARQPGMGLERIADEVFRDESDGENNSLGLRDPSARDALFYRAARLVTMTGQGSVSLLQRRLKIGYARAARLIDQLELAGIVGSYDGSKAREVLVDETYIDELEASNL